MASRVVLLGSDDSRWGGSWKLWRAELIAGALVGLTKGCPRGWWLTV